MRSPRTYISHIITHTHTYILCINIVVSRVKAFVDRINAVATFRNVFARRRMQIPVYTRIYYIYYLYTSIEERDSL